MPTNICISKLSYEVFSKELDCFFENELNDLNVDKEKFNAMLRILYKEISSNPAKKGRSVQVLKSELKRDWKLFQRD